MTDKSASAPPARLKLSTILMFSVVTLPGSALGIALAIDLSPYLTGHMGVALTVMGAAFFWVRLIDIPVDPILAIFMDRTRTRIGRYRVWLLIGAPILMFGVWRLFMPPAGIGQGYLILWLLALYLGTSITGLAQGAWSATLATDYNERSRLFGVVTMVGVIANLAVLLIPAIAGLAHLSDAQAVQAIGWLVIALTPICFGLVAWRVRETVAADVQTQQVPVRDYVALATKPAIWRLFLAQACLQLGPGWMSALYVFFFRDVLGFPFAVSSILLAVYIAATVIGAPATAWLSARFSKHRTLMAMTSLYSLGLCSILIMPKGNLWAITPVMIWCGFMNAGFSLLTSSMTADVGDEVRLEQGKQRMSLIYSLISLANKLAGAGQFLLSFSLLAWFGYNPKDGAYNTPAAIHGLATTYIWGPIFFVMLGGAFFVGWRLNAERHGEIRRALEIRDAALGEAELLGGLAGQPVPTLVPEPD